MKILISGGTGFVGQALVKKISKDHSLFLLVRSRDRAQSLFAKSSHAQNIHFIEWKDYYQEVDMSEHGQFDVAINLIGENIGHKKWSNERKKELYNSRIDATKTILNSLKKSQSKIKAFVSTSAVGIYTDGFLKHLCIAWEKSAEDHCRGFADRLCILRLGMVLGKGGAMDKILPPFKLGLGGKLGTGKQIMSWIHLEDLVSIYQFALDNESIIGPFNAVSSYSIDNNEFTHTLGKILRKPTKFTVPKFALRLLLGEMSCLMLDSTPADAKTLKETHFHYMYPTIELALKEVVSKK
jgi:uncharacterized protein (TIGR01777 family)